MRRLSESQKYSNCRRGHESSMKSECFFLCKHKELDKILGTTEVFA